MTENILNCENPETGCVLCKSVKESWLDLTLYKDLL